MADSISNTIYGGVIPNEACLSELIRRNDELAKSERFLKSVLEYITSVVYTKDLEGRYTFMNSEWERIMGRSRENSLGCNDHEIFPEEFARQFIKNDKWVLQAREVITTEEYFKKETGEDIIFLTTKVPMLDGEKLTGLCGISTEITERKWMEEELVVARRIAEDSAQSKADFLA
ncbi:MAG: PAS domain-containing protein, partial [Clostridiales bacterium]|nr:PAS domain-containing protein [Clostridiales bacterium]